MEPAGCKQATPVWFHLSGSQEQTKQIQGEKSQKSSCLRVDSEGLFPGKDRQETFWGDAMFSPLTWKVVAQVDARAKVSWAVS